MGIRTFYSGVNVLEAANQRIKNTFANGLPVYLSFSAGKDSACMSNLVYEMILHGEINPKQLHVIFFDEEAFHTSLA